jgi:hypothetical protein
VEIALVIAIAYAHLRESEANVWRWQDRAEDAYSRSVEPQEKVARIEATYYEYDVIGAAGPTRQTRTARHDQEIYERLTLEHRTWWLDETGHLDALMRR